MGLLSFGPAADSGAGKPIASSEIPKIGGGLRLPANCPEVYGNPCPKCLDHAS
jgi:hypothetical protein